MGEIFKANKNIYWKEDNRIRNGESRMEEVIKDMNRNIVEKSAARVRWAQYFDGL